MASHERRSIPKQTGEELDIGFKAAIGFYLGIIVAGLATVAGIVADASMAAILATAPSTVTAVLVLALIFGDRLRGLPERIGLSRSRRLGCYLPAVAFASMLVVPAFAPLEYSARLTTVTIAFTVLTATVAVGVARMTRNRYVAAATADEPTATWSWQNARFHSGVWDILTTVGALLLVAGGLVGIYTGHTNGMWFLLYGGFWLFMQWSETNGWFDADDEDGSKRWGSSDLRAHEAGIVLDRGHQQKLVPWDAIDDVRLTDDELVVERGRWLDIRCDRSAIDDPESVLEGIQHARERAERSRTAEFTH
ncbi:hypothetical protein [Natronorubrum texcoconense]|uniref:PH domain-containing protein n=1 Tax=Natronorubrum texcoconense TaxID=1095776 RepID=A0A1G8Y800_9EURY|nr:hypothetical protein [Natronorubrum texcoconense]SDJ98918.1 hypothetical protein SAMN04515672_2060 [Natronorubrum texcoconense]